MKKSSLFAKRTDWQLSSNIISQTYARYKQKYDDVINLAESNPTRCSFRYPQSKLLTPFKDGNNLKYDPVSKGLLSARKAVCQYYLERKIKIDPEQIFLTSSTSEGYSFLFQLLANPGDAVLFPYPSYPLFEFLVELNTLQMFSYPLVYEGEWKLDQRRFDHMLSPVFRAITLVNPNNPTGSILKGKDIQIIKKECARLEIPIICDEVFLDYKFEEANDYLSLAGNKQNLTFVLGGLSKALGLPQMKLSWIIVNGPKTQVSEAIRRMEVIADTYLSVNTPVQNALPQWMDLLPDIQGKILKRVKDNRRWLAQQLADDENIELLQADGGWYGVLKLKKNWDEEKIVLTLLKKDHVFVHPGYFFDFEHEGYLVVSLLLPLKQFQAGMKRIMNRLQRIKS